MFNNISWGSYCYALSIFVMIYYLVIAIVFYRRELPFYFQNLFRQGHGDKGTALTTDGNIPDESFSLAENVELPVRSLLDDLSVMISHAASRKYLKVELLQAIKVKLNSYQHLPQHEYKALINESIIADCKKYCSMHLDEEELEVLWFD